MQKQAPTTARAEHGKGARKTSEERPAGRNRRAAARRLLATEGRRRGVSRPARRAARPRRRAHAPQVGKRDATPDGGAAAPHTAERPQAERGQPRGGGGLSAPRGNPARPVRRRQTRRARDSAQRRRAPSGSGAPESHGGGADSAGAAAGEPARREHIAAHGERYGRFAAAVPPQLAEAQPRPYRFRLVQQLFYIAVLFT